MLVTGVSRKGGRRVNEDAYGEARAAGITCIVVADGLGGHNGGELASRLAVDTIIAEFTANPGFSERHIEDYILKANAAIISNAENDPEHVHMSSTVAVLLVRGTKAVWANVGDTRLYCFRNNEITDVTEDHSIAFLCFMRGEIEYDDIRNDENQNVLTSALGIGFKGMNVSPVTSVGGSASFLLCTDGWWEYVNEEQMEQTRADLKSSRAWLERMIDIHKDTAPEDCDNYTAVTVIL